MHLTALATLLWAVLLFVGRSYAPPFLDHTMLFMSGIGFGMAFVMYMLLSIIAQVEIVKEGDR